MTVRDSLDEGFTALERGRFDEAGRCAQAALERRPHDPRALVLAGNVARAGLYLADSLDYFERAVLASPHDPQPYVELARVYVRAGAYATAKDILSLGVARMPPTAANLAALAAATAEFGAEEARPLYERALALDPEAREVEFELAAVLLRLGKKEAAQRYARQAQSRLPQDRHSLNLRAMVADAEDDAGAVQAILEQGAREHPDEPSFLYNLHAVLKRRGLFAEAESVLGRLLEQFPDHANGRLAKAGLLLRRGEFREGFDAFEARRRLPDFPAVRHAPVPRWAGENLQGKRILVLDEQGLGDSLMFMRFLRPLQERGAAVRYLCHQPLYTLYAAQPWLRSVDVRLPSGDRNLHEACDYYLTLLSLPHVLQVSDPSAPSYIEPPEELIAEWAAKMPAEGRPRVGIAWSANPSAPTGAERSMPLQALRELLACPDFRFYSLQLGGGDAAKEMPSLLDLTAQIHDFADTFALVANLDFVVTVDTAVAHVAGALGKPVFVMAPLDVDWRWGGPVGRSYWYPWARVFRQAALGEWGPVVGEVLERVKKGI